MLSASVALGPIALVTHWKNITATGVPSCDMVGLLKVGPKPLACTRAHMNSVNPKIGIMRVFAMNMYLSVETLRYSNGSCMMMKRKKHSSSEEVTWALAGSLFLKWLKEGQMAEIMIWRHWPPWKLCVPGCSSVDPSSFVRSAHLPNQITATTPRMKTANFEPRMPNAERQ